MPQKARPGRAAEAGVVGDQRYPGDGQGDGQVDPGPEREPALAGRAGHGGQVEAGQGVPGEVGGGGEHGPDREALEPAAQHGQGPGHGHGGGQDPEGQHPQRPAAGAEHPLGDGGGGAGDHEQLEGGPAQVLDDVAGGGEQRAAHPERGPVQDHGRHAGGGGRHRGQPEQGVADHGPDHGGGQGRPEPEGRGPAGPRRPARAADAEVAQRTAWSRKPRRRRSGGTGSMPHSGACWTERDRWRAAMSRSLRRY